MTTDATASPTRAWLPILIGAAAIGVLSGGYELRSATSGPCGATAPAGRSTCAVDHVGPSLIGVAGLVVLLLVLSAAAAGISPRRHAVAFTTPLVLAGSSAALTVHLEPASPTTWFDSAAVVVALTAASFTGRVPRGARGHPARTGPPPREARPDAGETVTRST